MAPGANSYGTAANVAALTRRYTNSGMYDASTNPALTTVETWIDQASANLNVALAGAGFAIPITQADAKAACLSVVVEAVADLCHAANSAGRFFTEKALERGISPMRAIRSEMAKWVEDQADGLELLGATRTRARTAGILSLDTDDNGVETSPIFKRGDFGGI